MKKFYYFCFTCLGLLLLFYIFYGCKSLLNSDSAFIVDYAIEQIRLRDIFPTGWIESNDFWIYSLIPFINLFLRFGISLFTSRQCAVFLQSIILFYLLYKLCYKALDNKTGSKIVFILIISGISAQLLFEIFGDATYGTIIIFMLLGLIIFIEYFKKYQKRYLYIIFLLISLLTCFSLRFPIFLVAPLIVCMLIMFLEKKLEKKDYYMIISIILGVIIGYILHTYLSTILIYKTGFDNKYIINNESSLWQNTSTLIHDIFWLLGSTNKSIFSLTVSYSLDIKTSSVLVLFVFLRFIYTIITVSLPIILLKKYKSFTKNEKIVYIYTLSLFVIITFFYVFGNMSSWYRYLTPVLFFLNILYAIFYKYYIKNKNQKIIFYCGLSLILIYAVFLNISGWYSFRNLKLKENHYQPITNYLIEKDLSFGYTTNDREHNLFRLLSNNKVQIIRIDHNIKPYYWLNSTKWYEKDYYKGKVFLIRPVYEEPLSIEQYAIQKQNFDNYQIFIFSSNDIFIKSFNTNT